MLRTINSVALVRHIMVEEEDPARERLSTRSRVHRVGVTSITFVCSDHFRKVEPIESIAVDPEMKRTSDIGVPVKKRAITLHLEQQYIFQVLLCRILRATAISQHLMQGGVEMTVLAISHGRRLPMILTREVRKIAERNVVEGIDVLLCHASDRMID